MSRHDVTIDNINLYHLRYIKRRMIMKKGIYTENCLDFLPTLDKDSVHLVITDPPYFLDGFDNNWKKGQLLIKEKTGVIGGLPVGMKFDPRQGIALQKFMTEVSNLMYPVMKPGAFAVVFSQPRLAHRMAIALENANFEIRDLYAWHFNRRSQPKAFSMNHFVRQMDKSDDEKKELIEKLQGRKTPQLRPQFEVMILAQKPRIGTFIENWMAHETGLIDIEASLDGKTPTTIMTVEKPSRSQIKGHLTVKPVRLIEHLIKLFSIPGQTVLDPFLGSGTTAVAAKKLGRLCIGIEINPEYVSIAKRRIDMALDGGKRMNGGIRPKQHARMGMFYLEESVLDVLLESKYEQECLGPAEISKRAGIFRERGSVNIMNDAIVTGILVKLADEDRVQRCEQPNMQGGWELTDKEFAERRDDTGYKI